MICKPLLLSFILLPAVLAASNAWAVDTFFENRVVNSSLTSDAALGDPVTVTWSIVPDGTDVITSSRDTDLIATLDAFHNVTDTSNTDLTQRVWFAPIQNALDSFTNKCGLTYIYEPNDDGAPLSTVNGRFTTGQTFDNQTSTGESFTGEPGVRGDLRITGIGVIGALGFTSVPSTTPTPNFTPVDRGHSNIFLTTAVDLDLNSIDFLITHENLHATGSQHIRINDTNNLSAVTGSGGTRAGPQFPDLLGLHRRYGDFFEKNGGNDTLNTATDLGSVSSTSTARIGFDAGIGSSTAALQVADEQVDFVSIDGDTDTDFFRFTSTSATDEVVIHLTPRGPAYTYTNEIIASGGEPTEFNIDASMQSNLGFRLLDSSGNILQTVDANGVGLGESIALTLGAGDFFIEVSGDADNPQFFALEITSSPPTTTIFGQNFASSSPVSNINGPVADATLINLTSGEIITGGASGSQTTNGDYTIVILGGGGNADDGYIFNETPNSGFNAFDIDYSFETGTISFTSAGTTYSGTVLLRQNVNVGQEFINIEAISLLEDDITGEIFIELDYNFFADVGGNDQFFLTTNFGVDNDVTNLDVLTADGFSGSNLTGDSTFRLTLVPGSSALKGDVNLDGAVNFLDISAFISVLASDGFQAEADTNCDNVVNFLDIASFIAILASQ